MLIKEMQALALNVELLEDEEEFRRGDPPAM